MGLQEEGQVGRSAGGPWPPFLFLARSRTRFGRLAGVAVAHLGDQGGKQALFVLRHLIHRGGVQVQELVESLQAAERENERWYAQQGRLSSLEDGRVAGHQPGVDLWMQGRRTRESSQLDGFSHIDLSRFAIKLSKGNKGFWVLTSTTSSSMPRLRPSVSKGQPRAKSLRRNISLPRNGAAVW